MGATILLADDSITIQKVIELTFAETEHRVVAVGSGRDLLDRVSTLHPDAVLCDVVMPDMNGYDLCQTLKSDPATLHIPVVLLTGTFEPFDRSRALAAGCDAIVTKPFEAEELIRTVEELLRRQPQASTTVAVGLEAVGVPEGVPALDFTTTGFERMGVKESSPEPEIPEDGLEFTSTGVVAPPAPVPAVGEDIFTPAGGSAPPQGSGEELPVAEEMEAGAIEDETFPSAPPSLRPPAEEFFGAPGESAFAAPEEEAPPEEEEAVSVFPVTAAVPEDAAVAAEDLEDRTVATPPAAVPPGVVPPAAAPPATAQLVRAEVNRLSEEEIDRIARKVLELATPLIERIAWEVTPDMAEMLVRKRIRELEEAAADEA